MADITELKGIKDRHVSILRSKGIETIDDLWDCVGKDPDRGIVRLARLTHIPRDDLTRLLVNQGVHEATVEGSSWFWRHLFDLLLGAGVVALCVLVLRAFGGLALLPEPIGGQKTAVVAARNLEPGHTVGAGDVGSTLLLAGDDIITSTEQLEGAIIAQRVAAGTPLRIGDVLHPNALVGRQIVSLVIAGGGASPTVQPGDRVTLHFVPKDSNAARVSALDNVIVLAVNRLDDPPTVVVAIMAHDIDTVAPVLGQSDVVILETMR